jgi:nitrite reductase/ring-hydroxylating ferredoxin subunit
MTVPEQAWRQDFPIDAAQDRYMARRDFTRFLMLTSVACGVGQVCIGVRNWLRGKPAPPPPQPVARMDEIRVGSVRPFSYPDAGSPCLLLRPDEHTFIAFGQKCTHLGCAVTPDAEGRRLRCPCHNGLFDAATGRPLAGPPRRPLPRVALEVREGLLYAVGFEEPPV